MKSTAEKPELRQDVVAALRDLASHGASVRALADEIRKRLDYRGDSALPIVWYFSEAFMLPLPDVLPIREWFGTSADAEIDALILPRIARQRDRWTSVLAENGGVAEHPKGQGLTAAKQRG